MSVEALTWAFRQKVPPKPKIVLLALADQADEVTGLVCYGKVNVKYLAGKANVGERSFYRYVGALARNGYLTKESGARKGEASQYWLCLDRKADGLAWIWGTPEKKDPDEDDPQDVVEATPPWQGSDDDEIGIPPRPSVGIPPLPQDGRQESTSNINTSSEHPTKIAPSFNRQAQDVERGAPSGAGGWFERTSKEAKAIGVLCQIIGKEHYFYEVMGGRQTVLYRGDVTPALLALAEAPARSLWISTDDPQQVGAWSSFAFKYAPTKNFRIRAPIKVPWPWPPKRDGSKYDRPTDSLADEHSAAL